MNAPRLLFTGLLLGALAFLTPAHAARQVVTLSWPTRNAAPAPDLEPPADTFLPALRFAVSRLPESATVNLALSQPSFLGLTSADAELLQRLVAQRYQKIAADPVFARVPSALTYCFADEKPASGLATLYVPANAGPQTPAIVFLHGYGGSFLWYLHYLAELFPNHVILAPAHGMSDAGMPPDYALEAVRAAEKRLGFPLAKPTLIGLSAGGFNACRTYVVYPARFTSLRVLAAYPPPETLARFPKNSVPRFLAGGSEFYVTDGTWESARRQLALRGTAAQFATVPAAGHFFLLTHPKESAAWLRAK